MQNKYFRGYEDGFQKAIDLLVSKKDNMSSLNDKAMIEACIMTLQQEAFFIRQMSAINAYALKSAQIIAKAGNISSITTS